VILAAVVAAAVLVVMVLAIHALRRRTVAVPADGDTPWTQTAGDEFAALSEAERCDLAFALAAFDDERSRRVLTRALTDDSEPVALAAAQALVSHGGLALVEAYLAANPGERAKRIDDALTLLKSEP
jgi:hypothetical protein